MSEKKTKTCPKCLFQIKYNRSNIETFFGYRSVSDKGQPIPQSYCRECRNEKEDKTPKKKKPGVRKVEMKKDAKPKEVKEEMTVGEVVLRKEIDKMSEDKKKGIKETYKKMFPQDKSRRGYDYMQARIEKTNASKTA